MATCSTVPGCSRLPSGPFDLLRPDPLDQLDLQVDRLGDGDLGQLEPSGYRGLVGRCIAGGNQTQPIGVEPASTMMMSMPPSAVATACHDHLEDRFGQIFIGGKGDPFALLQCQADPAERPFERNAAR